MLGPVELDWLETFLAVVDRGGFTAASERVHRSQSRVSAHIAALERDLGVQLIDRTRRPATLTSAGEVFVRHARDLVAGVGSARAAVGALRLLDAEVLRVATTPCLAAALFPGVVAELAELHPGVRLVVHERADDDNENGPLADGSVLAVLPRTGRTPPAGVCERVLWTEPLRVVVPAGHEWAGRAPHRGAGTGSRGGDERPAAEVGVAELTGRPLLVCGSGPDTAPEAVVQLAARGLAVRPRAVVGSAHTLLALVRAGAGVGLVNAVALGGADAAGLVVLDTDSPPLERRVAAYWHDGLVTGGPAMELHRIVLAAGAPSGATAEGHLHGLPALNGWRASQRR